MEDSTFLHNTQRSMDNQTNLTVPVSEFVIGVSYITFGLLGILANVVTALLIAVDKEMRNPTYYYMINLCLADAVMLIPLAIFCGLVLAYPPVLNLTFVKVGAYLLTTGWNPSCLFMVLMSCSRYVQLRSPPTSSLTSTDRESRKVWASILLPWIIPAIIYTWILDYEPPPVILVLKQYCWLFDEATTLGQGLHWLTVLWISSVLVLITYFNSKSMLAVRRMRKQIQHIQMDRNMKREIKLFIQCALTAAMYSAMAITYFGVNGIKKGVASAGFVAAQLLWILNHSHSPIVYYILNTRLRRRLGRLTGLRRRKQTPQSKSQEFSLAPIPDGTVRAHESVPS